MELGIKGNETRGDEIIKILEMLGGKNRHEMRGSIYDKYFYYIDDEYKDISYSYIGPDEIKGYKIFSLEDFLEKYPYKVGDKVNVWVNYEHLGGPRAELEEAEIKSMRWNSARCRIVYKMKDINREFCVEDIKGKVDEEQIDYAELVNKTYEEEVGKMAAKITMDTLYKTGITHEYLKERGFNLPEGYHFTDENGNVVNATKILLVKNAPLYPKTYEECCDVIGINRHEVEIDIPQPYQQNMFNLFKLIICRNAYWKIAGDYLELDKPWEPDWTNPDIDLYVIINSSYNEVYETEYERGSGQRIFAFPTIEMRDEFHNNFKNLIEQCKELL